MVENRTSSRAQQRMIRRRNRRIAIVTAVSLLLLSALGGILLRQTGGWDSWFTAEYSDRPLQLGMVQVPTTLDPALMSDRASRLVGMNLYEGLLGLDPETMEIVPALAESWKISTDARVFTFKLRRGVMFHSGRELVADDVRRSWERVLDPALNSSQRYLLLPIQGARARAEGQAGAVSGIEVISDRELRVTLEQPNASFLYRMAMPPFGVADCDAIQAAGKSFGQPGSASAGSGSFKLQDWTPEQLVLIIHEGYWGGAPHLKQAVFNYFNSSVQALEAYQQGELDYLDEIPSAQLPVLAGNDSWRPQLKRQPLLDSYFYQFNLQDPVWGKSVALRQAVNYALDKEALNQKLFSGASLPMSSLIPAGFRGYEPPAFPYQYDPQRAAQLLTEAGYPGGQGLPVLQLAFNELPSHRVVAEAVSEQLNKVGIKTKLVAVPWKDYKGALAQGRYSSFRGGWSWDYPDPDDLFFYNFHSSQIGTNNFSFLRSEQLDTLLTSARVESENEKKRMSYYKQAETIINQESPLIWLFSWQRVSMVSPAVRQLKVNSLDLIPLEKIGIIP